jgi:membrane-bound acyltransferase YfiQ involved in biofilm formation
MLNVFSIFYLKGKLAAKDAPNTHTNQNSHSVNALEVQNLDEIYSFVEKSKEKTDVVMYLSYFISIFLNCLTTYWILLLPVELKCIAKQKHKRYTLPGKP